MAAKKTAKKPKAKPKKASAKKASAKKASAKKASAKKASAKRASAKKASAKKTGAKLTVDGWLKQKAKAPMMTLAMEIVDWMSAAEPIVTSSIKWGQPVWEANGPLAWLNTSAGHVSFGFWRGAELVDPDGLLEGTGTKMRHTKLKPGDLTKETQRKLAGLLRQAVDLNVAKGDPTRRKSA